MTDATLNDFVGESENPLLVVTDQVRHDAQQDGNTPLVGYLATSNRGTSYVSPRRREDHLYRKRKAYAISRELLGTVIRPNDVDAIFIAEEDTETMYEYPAEFFTPDYMYSFELDYRSEDPQLAVPTEKARRWEADEVSLTL